MYDSEAVVFCGVANSFCPDISDLCGVAGESEPFAVNSGTAAGAPNSG